MGFLFIDYLFITTTIIFLAWLLNEGNECDDLPGSVTPPQASMKLSAPHRSPSLTRWHSPHCHPCPPRSCCCSPPRRRCSPDWVAGTTSTAGMAGTVDSPAQGG